MDIHVIHVDAPLHHDAFTTFMKENHSYPHHNHNNHNNHSTHNNHNIHNNHNSHSNHSHNNHNNHYPRHIHHHHLPLPLPLPDFSIGNINNHSSSGSSGISGKSSSGGSHIDGNTLLDDFIAGGHSTSGSSSSNSSCPPLSSSSPLSSSGGSGDGDNEVRVLVNGIDLSTVPIVPTAGAGGTTVIDGVTYNNRGYEVCGALNKFNKPCQRIGKCPFHPDHKKTEPMQLPPLEQGRPHTAAPIESRKYLPIKKGPYKSGWKKDEHLRFLKGLQIHGRGSWKDIALIVGTRTPTQIQVHAHRYYLRQQQGTKNKRSIHDISLEDLEELEVQHGAIMPGPNSPLPQLSPPSPDPSSSPTDISQLFQHHSSFSHSSQHSSSTNNNHMRSPPSPPSIHSSSFPSSSTNFPPLFPSTSSLSSTLPGLPPLPLPIPGSSASFSMNYHSSPWFPSSSFPPMSNLGYDNLAPLPPSFPNDDCEDEDITDIDFNVSHHHISHNAHHHDNNDNNDDDEDDE